jgi:hypothetical protein
MWSSDGKREEVRFAHFSVKEYLLSDRITKSKPPVSIFAIHEPNAHEFAATLSIVFLQWAIENVSIRDQMSLYRYFAAKSDQPRFSDYVIDFWPRHVHACTNNGRQMLEQTLVRRLFDSTFHKDDEPKRPTVFRDYSFPDYAGPHDIPPLLYYSSFLGFTDVSNWLLQTGADINAKGGFFGNALQAASWHGHEAVVRLLLEKGANVNAEGGCYGNALQAASWCGREAVVRLLLEKGANVNAEGGRYGSALQAASWHGHETVVRLLLEKGANVNAEGGQMAVLCKLHRGMVMRLWFDCFWRRERQLHLHYLPEITNCNL